MHSVLKVPCSVLFLAVSACSSSSSSPGGTDSGASSSSPDGAAETGNPGDAGGNEGGSSAVLDGGANSSPDGAVPAEDGSVAEVDGGDPCAALFDCCSKLDDITFINGGVRPTAESACIEVALSEQTETCAANLAHYAPNGVCGAGFTGDAGAAACGQQCTTLAGCCPKLGTVDAGSLVPGCTALATTCTTGSESYCVEVNQIMTGVTLTAGFAHFACP